MDCVFDYTGGNASTTASARKPTKQKRGTANTLVEEEEDGEEAEGRRFSRRPDGEEAEEV